MPAVAGQWLLACFPPVRMMLLCETSLGQLGLALPAGSPPSSLCPHLLAREQENLKILCLIFLSHNRNHGCVINALLVLNPKPIPGPATGNKTSSIAAQRRRAAPCAGPLLVPKPWLPPGWQSRGCCRHWGALAPSPRSSGSPGLWKVCSCSPR